MWLAMVKMLGDKLESVEGSLKSAVPKKQEIYDIKLMIEILKPFEVFSELVSWLKR